jgi:hypothetical protein
LQHLDWIAAVEVEDFIGAETVHLAEGVGLKQVIDCSGRSARARIAHISESGGRDDFVGGIGLDKPATFSRMGREPEETLYFVCRQDLFPQVF